MSCLKTLVVLGCVLGAVRTGVVAQTNCSKLTVPCGPVAAGEVVPFTLVHPAAGPMDYALFVAPQTGLTSVSTTAGTFIVPLDPAMVLVAAGTSSANRVTSWFVAPTLPTLSGILPRAAGMTVSQGILRVSAAVPFGPIIEDSIQ